MGGKPGRSKWHTVKQRLERGYRILNACWIWLGCGTRLEEYGKIWVNGRRKLVHRVAFESWRGPIPCGLWVLHTCDTPACINPDHLFLGDCIANVVDMHSKRRNARGEKQHLSKLTANDVTTIRKDNRKYAEIGKDFCVSTATICDVKNRKTWKHVKLT